MWIVLTLACAFFQALWMALSKRRLQTLPPLRFMLFQRLPIALLMVPVFFCFELPRVTLRFWAIGLLAAATECGRLVLFARGTRRDYYTTYSLLNMSPLFILIIAPFVLGDKVNLLVLAGAFCVIAGGFIFYRSGRFQWAGLMAAACSGVLTVLSKMCLNLSSPICFMIMLYAASTVMLLLAEAAQCGLGATLRSYRATAGDTLPITALNLVSIVTFVYALDLATATQYGVLFRTNLVFGFVLSLVMLKEFKGWPWKLAGATFIILGSLLIVMSKG